MSQPTLTNGHPIDPPGRWLTAVPTLTEPTTEPAGGAVPGNGANTPGNAETPPPGKDAGPTTKPGVRGLSSAGTVLSGQDAEPGGSHGAYRPLTPSGYSGFGSDTGASVASLVDQANTRVTQVRAWLPPVDPAVFDCHVGRLACALDPHTEADPINVMVTLLAAAGVHVGPDVVFPVSFERHPLLTWPIIIGPTGSGKKGTGFNTARALLAATDAGFTAMNIRSGLSTGEGLAAVFAVDEDSKGKTRLLPEGDVRLLAYEPEWASVMARMKREGNTLPATLRAAWEGGDMTTLNVDARVALRSHVGIVAHITPEEFLAKVSASDMAGGTYNRFLPIAVAQSKFLPTPGTGDAVLLGRLGQELAERLTVAAGFTTIAIHPTAVEDWTRLYLDFGAAADADGHTTLAQFTSRAAPNCLRIAALHAALDTTPLIRREHLVAAAALVRYSIDSARAVLSSNQDRDTTRLIEFIAAAGPGGRTRKEITTDCFRGRVKADRISALLDQLLSEAVITHHRRPRADGRPGRATDVYTADTPRT